MKTKLPLKLAALQTDMFAGTEISPYLPHGRRLQCTLCPAIVSLKHRYIHLWVAHKIKTIAGSFK